MQNRSRQPPVVDGHGEKGEGEEGEGGGGGGGAPKRVVKFL